MWLPLVLVLVLLPPPRAAVRHLSGAAQVDGQTVVLMGGPAMGSSKYGLQRRGSHGLPAVLSVQIRDQPRFSYPVFRRNPRLRCRGRQMAHHCRFPRLQHTRDAKHVVLSWVLRCRLWPLTAVMRLARVELTHCWPMICRSLHRSFRRTAGRVARLRSNARIHAVMRMDSCVLGV
jgi:hypothetical protein